MDSSRSSCVEYSKMNQNELNEMLLLFCSSESKIVFYNNEVSDLLAAGANVETKTEGNLTPLMLAAQNGNASTILVLLAAGANIKAKDCMGNTALHWAAFNGNECTLGYLIDAPGSDSILNVRNRLERTALIGAVRHGHLGAVLPLLAAKAEVSLVCGRGETLLLIACDNHYKKIAFRLLSDMKHQEVMAIKPSPTSIRRFATLCEKKVLELQKDMFYMLHTFLDKKKVSKGPAILIAFNLYPIWYQHRIKADVDLILKKLTQLRVVREEKTRASFSVAEVLPSQTVTFSRVIRRERPIENHPVVAREYQLWGDKNTTNMFDVSRKISSKL